MKLRSSPPSLEQLQARVGLAIVILAGIALIWIACWSFYTSRLPALVQISSAPQGAEVWRDGRLLGHSPIAEKLQGRKEVTYMLRAAGYDDAYFCDPLTPNHILSIHAQLPPKAQMGSTLCGTRVVAAPASSTRCPLTQD